MFKKLFFALTLIGLLAAGLSLARPATPAHAQIVGDGDCPVDFMFVSAFLLPEVDRNGDGWMCGKATEPAVELPIFCADLLDCYDLFVDNNVPGRIGTCPDDFRIMAFGGSIDRNGDGAVCYKQIDNRKIVIDNVVVSP